MNILVIVFRVGYLHYFYDYLQGVLAPSHYIVWCGFGSDTPLHEDDDGRQRECLAILARLNRSAPVLCVNEIPLTAFAALLAAAHKRDDLWLFVSEQATIASVRALNANNARRFPWLYFLHYAGANQRLFFDYAVGRRQRNILLPYQPCDVGEYAAYWNHSKRHDVAFVGTRSARRTSVIERLRQRRLDVVVIEKFGVERNALIAASRFLVNVHFSEEYRVLESLRCVLAASLGTDVLSETSVPQPLHGLENTFAFAAYDDLVELVVERVRTYNAQSASRRRLQQLLTHYSAREATHCTPGFTLRDLAN